MSDQTKQIFDEEHYLYNLFIRYHSGVLTPVERNMAKSILHDVHYGQWDTKQAMDKAIEIRNQINKE